jgi:hypothetical protein
MAYAKKRRFFGRKNAREKGDSYTILYSVQRSIGIYN